MPNLNRRTRKSSQRGVYAVEWAIVFPVFFVLVYAIVSYGLVFLVRESMQNAVEDGARAALRYQVDRGDRLNTAEAVTEARLSWLPVALRPVVEVSVCRLETSAICAPTLSCTSQWAYRCLVRVNAAVNYGAAPLVPALPGFEILIPEVMSASASILVDPGGF